MGRSGDGDIGGCEIDIKGAGVLVCTDFHFNYMWLGMMRRDDEKFSGCRTDTMERRWLESVRVIEQAVSYKLWSEEVYIIQ